MLSVSSGTSWFCRHRSILCRLQTGVQYRQVSALQRIAEHCSALQSTAVQSVPGQYQGSSPYCTVLEGLAQQWWYHMRLSPCQKIPGSLYCTGSAPGLGRWNRRNTVQATTKYSTVQCNYNNAATADCWLLLARRGTSEIDDSGHAWVVHPQHQLSSNSNTQSYTPEHQHLQDRRLLQYHIPRVAQRKRRCDCLCGANLSVALFFIWLFEFSYNWCISGPLVDKRTQYNY